MPKKRKKSEESKKEKEKILDELSVRLKLNKENGDLKEDESQEETEESELEEEVDDSDLNLNLNLQGLEFHQFMELQEGQTAGAPVLERIAGSQPRPIFVGGIPRETGTATNSKDSGDEFRYVPGTADANGPKYFEEPGIRDMPERIDLTTAGRTRTTGFREEISQERFFMQSEPRIESHSQERFERPERFDAEQAGRRNPSERSEAKYEKYRPKLPKG